MTHATIALKILDDRLRGSASQPPLLPAYATPGSAGLDLRACLEARNLLDQALFAQRVGWPDQQLSPAALVSAAEQPYFSLLLIRQGWPAVLP